MQEVFEKIKQRIRIAATEACGYTPITRVVSEAELKEIIEQAATEYNNGWIPCNGVLYPDDMEDVLINMGGLKAIPAYRQNGKWYLTDCRGSSTEVKDQSLVIEWQPLPESC